MFRRGRLRPLTVHHAGQLHVVEVAEAARSGIDQMHAGVAGCAARTSAPRSSGGSAQPRRRTVYGRVVETGLRVAQGDERAEDRRACARATVNRPVRRVSWVVRNVKRCARCADAGAGDRSGLSSPTRPRSTSPARSACSARPRVAGRGAPRLEQAVQRVRVAEIPGFGQGAIERGNIAICMRT